MESEKMVYEQELLHYFTHPFISHLYIWSLPCKEMLTPDLSLAHLLPIIDW